MSDNLEEPSKNEPRFSFFKSLPKPQRAAFLFLSVLSLGVFILWLWQFNFRLTGPFKTPSEGGDSDTTSLQAFEADLINFDTDKDGLSDIEEQSLYATSIYLADTDSDGLSDRAEIEAGSNPNCAIGQTCAGEDLLLNQPIASTSISIPNADIVATSSDNSTDSGLELMMSGGSDAAQLRTLLINSGADAAMLQQLSDEELLKAYREMLAAQGTTQP
jgi:hypothetical protein